MRAFSFNSTNDKNTARFEKVNPNNIFILCGCSLRNRTGLLKYFRDYFLCPYSPDWTRELYLWLHCQQLVKQSVAVVAQSVEMREMSATFSVSVALPMANHFCTTLASSQVPEQALLCSIVTLNNTKASMYVSQCLHLATSWMPSKVQKRALKANYRDPRPTIISRMQGAS